MRIAFDDHIFSWQKYGGISRYFYELATAFAMDQSVEIKIISPLHVNQYVDSSSRAFFTGIRMPAGSYLPKGYRIANRILAPLYRRRFRPEIFHETYYSEYGEYVGQAKRVLTVYDMIHEKFPKYFDPRDKTSRRKAAAVKRADHVICISENTRSDLIEILDVPYEKTSVVHLGFSFGNVDLLNAESDKPNPFLLYVGERSGYKNFSTLLDVYANQQFLRNNFQLIAFGGGHFSSLELDKINSLNLDSSRVKQVAGNDEVLRGLYRTASLFIYPSIYEGFGIPPLEAMSMGCPVACSNTSSLPEVIGDAAIFFDPSSEDSMARAILCCLEDEVLRSDLILKGANLIKNYSWQKCADETKAVYAGLLA